MKTVLTTLCILAVATMALAEKPVIPSGDWTPARIACPFEVVTYDWDFAQGDQGFTTSVCDDTGGAPVWAHGTDANFPATVWGTVLNGDYISDAGEALVSPEFMVDTSTNLVQVTHFFEFENSYDGGNLMVNGTVVAPMDGYNDDELSDSVNYYAFCVDGQPGLTDDPLVPYEMITSCFDLSAFEGETVSLEFQFGSDSSVTYLGWYLGGVKVGGTEPVGTTDASWDAMKALYR